MDQYTKDIIECLKFMGKANKPKVPPSFLKTGVMDMTLAQLDIMAYLYEAKKVKMSDLAKQAGVKLPTMTDMVNKLVRAGFVKREHDEADRRTVWVSVTKEMEKMVYAHIKERDDVTMGIMECLTQKEKQQAAVILKKIKKAMEERMAQ